MTNQIDPLSLTITNSPNHQLFCDPSLGGADELYQAFYFRPFAQLIPDRLDRLAGIELGREQQAKSVVDPAYFIP